MSRSRKRTILHLSDRNTALRNLERGRCGAIIVRTNTKFGSPEYVAAGAVMEAINDLAEMLAGNRDLVWEQIAKGEPIT